MSIKVMSWVWDVSALKGSEKMVMLCLADHADDKGFCWPSIQTIARKSGISVSTVKATLKKLEGAGWLKKRNQFKKSETGRLVRDSNQYQLALKALKNAADEVELKLECLEFSRSAAEPSNLEQPESERSNFERSEKCVFNSQILALGRSKSGYKPSLDPSVDPPIKDLAPSKLLEAAEEEPICSLVLRGGDIHSVRPSDISDLRSMYPGIDILHELRRMMAWCIDNPKNRKTKAGVSRFIGNWLRKERDKVLLRRASSTNLSPSEEFRQYLYSQGREVAF